MSFLIKPGASRTEIEEIVNKLTKKLQTSGNVMGSVSIGVAIAGILVELMIKKDFGYVLIALGILVLAQGLTLKYVFR